MSEPKPCPAGKCDAELYSTGEFVFCPKCGGRNPNYHLRTEAPQVFRASVVRTKQQPLFGPETGVMKW